MGTARARRLAGGGGRRLPPQVCADIRTSVYAHQLAHARRHPAEAARNEATPPRNTRFAAIDHVPPAEAEANDGSQEPSAHAGPTRANGSP